MEWGVKSEPKRNPCLSPVVRLAATAHQVDFYPLYLYLSGYGKNT